MNNQIKQIKDNVERIKKGCKRKIKTFYVDDGMEYLVCGKPNEITDLYNLKLGEIMICECCQTKLKTTIAENIKWADAMIEELELFKASLHWYIRPSGKAERDIEHISTKIKKWQETKQWLEERQ